MAEVYSRNQMKVTVAKMLQTIGWNSINSTPLEILTDIIVQYVVQLARTTHDYATEFGCVHPSLDHLGLAFRDFHISLTDLEEYVTYVNFAPPPSAVPKFPVAKENNLNFLKPGSKEVITRQVHVHEHLPPMFHNLEVHEAESQVQIKAEEVEEMVNDELALPVFKRPADVSPNETFKKPRLNEEEGRPTREIISVMMTTSGYISPAREGKMPESRTPTPAMDPMPVQASTLPSGVIAGTTAKNTHSVALVSADVPLPTATATLEGATSLPLAKVKSSKKASDKPEKRKLSKELFKTATTPGGAGGGVGGSGSEASSKKLEKVKRPPKEPKQPKKALGTPKKLKEKEATSEKGTPKVNKALAAARMKTEKLNTTITPIPKPIDKLSNEPDRKKANIFKKISNVKAAEREGGKRPDVVRTPGHSPDLVVDDAGGGEGLDAKLHLPGDVTIELVNAVEKPEKTYFDDESPPSTPKTPEMMMTMTTTVTPTPLTPAPMVVVPPVVKEKRKRKDKTRVKKVVKAKEMDMERPKTPEVRLPVCPPPAPSALLAPPAFPQFPTFPAFPGPVGGLSCPPQLISPLIPMNPLGPFFGMTPPPGLPAFMNRPPGLPAFLPPIPLKPPVATLPPVIPCPPSSAVELKTKPDTTCPDGSDSPASSPRLESGTKRKKDKKDKARKRSKKDKLKSKGEKRKMRDERKDKVRKEKKEKRKEKEKERESNVNLKLTLKIGGGGAVGEGSPRPETPDRKLNIKPVIKIKREEDATVATTTTSTETKRELSPELAKISALVTGQPKPKLSPVVPAKEEAVGEGKASSPQPPQSQPPPGPCRPTAGGGRPAGPGRPRIHPIKPKPLKSAKRQPIPAKDSEGNEVWICPACGRQDDGSPMIGCDDCDAWYHWVCVGIQVPPDETENWYCRLCIAKKQEVLHTDKKKKRKKKEKKEH